ncbi:MAG: UDP-N-acetylmuramoyl-L-alanine--D-glutamate ligase [Bellilinea sp.]
MMRIWTDQRVLIIGAARQGLALARYLAKQGAAVTLNDQRNAEQLAAAVESLKELSVHWVLGSHPLELLEKTDLVCLSGGVPPDMPLAVEAARRGIPLSNDSQLFLEAVPCPVIGITGSAGKTTTTTLVGRMAEAYLKAPNRAWVGGNIGTPLIDQLDAIKPADLVILELSSFQLELMTIAPQVAAVLNITPNHLDRHGTLEAYAAAKARILEYQGPNSVSVLNRDDAGSWSLAGKIRGRLVTFGLARPAPGTPGTFFENGELFWQFEGTAQPLLSQSSILLRGEHNLANVLAAAAIAFAAGFAPEAVADGVHGFAGVPHRLQHVRELRGVNYYNDSIATAPERTCAAIRSFDEPIVLLLGGRDKNLPWDELAALVHERVDHVIVFGEASTKILLALGSVKPGRRPYTVQHCGDLETAVKSGAEVAEPGSVVLLSPGGTSYDQFKDFEERGEAYQLWVNRLP